MRPKFSTLLLTGKAATLPLLMGNAHALTPSYTDIVTTELTQVQLPVANSVQLNVLGSPTYDGSATLCTNAGVANKMSVVLTGLNDQDMLYVITSTNLGGNTAFNPRLAIGTQNVMIPVAMTVRAPGSAAVAVTVSLDLNELRARGYSFNSGSKFYMQSVVVPASAMLGGIPNLAQARYSEVDAVSVAACTTPSPYGSTYGTY